MMATWRIDRRFTGVGRLARFSGTTHAPTFKRINQMLDGLYNIGRLDVLAWVRDGVHTPLVVLHHWERGQIDRLPSPEAAGGLVDALWAFQKTHECGDSHRADIATSVRHVERIANKNATVGELPKILRAAKEKMRATPVAFNRLRTHLLGFLSETQGKHSPPWVELARVNRFKKAEGVRPRALLRRPLTVAELDLVCAVFVDVPVYGGRRGYENTGTKVLRRTILAADLAHMAKALATTGMRPQEYWQRKGASWSTIATTRTQLHVYVEGTKTPAARRPTFALFVLYRPGCGEQFFRQQFAKATEKALRVGLDTYSLRRTFASWCESAGVVESRRKAYLGHGPKTVTDLYLRTNVLPFVQEDAALVTWWIEAERKRAAAQSKHTESHTIAIVRG